MSSLFEGLGIKMADPTSVEAWKPFIGPTEGWAHQCHAISLAMVRSGMLGDKARVARGSAHGVGGQHSWVMFGDDPYDPETVIVDGTIWSYLDQHPVIVVGRLKDLSHAAHGKGLIFDYGVPMGGGDPITLDAKGLSSQAIGFLDMIARTNGYALTSLPIGAWMQLFNGPMQGWPAGEIITKAYKDRRLKALIPVDIVGMLTNENPGGLYW